MIKELKGPEKYKGEFSGAFYSVNCNESQEYRFDAFPNKQFDMDEKIHERMGFKPIIIIRNINQEFITKAKIFVANTNNQEEKLDTKSITIEKILNATLEE